MHLNAHARRAAARSYTLIELIMVIAVLALAAALLVPNMVGTDSLTVQAAIRLMISDLSFAQSDALANQEFRRVVFYDDGTGYCLIRVPNEDFVTPSDLDAYTDYVLDPLGTMGRYIVSYAQDDRFEGVAITAATIDGVDIADRPEITYDMLGGTVMAGGIPGTGGTLTVTFDAVNYQVTIAPFTGKLTVTEL